MYIVYMQKYFSLRLWNTTAYLLRIPFQYNFHMLNYTCCLHCIYWALQSSTPVSRMLSELQNFKNLCSFDQLTACVSLGKKWKKSGLDAKYVGQI